MATRHPLGLAPGSVCLEAEVNPAMQQEFSKRYLAATRDFVCTGDPPEYQNQPNKCGAELRIYFNADDATLSRLRSRGHDVTQTAGYRDAYTYRINSNDLWWDLVENYGYRLGVN